MHFVSLGCPKNLVDSEVMLGVLRHNEHRIVDQPEDADVIVINTCAFIESARAESIEAIREMADYKLGGACKRLVVAGCLAQRYRDELRAELPEIDEIVGTGEILSIDSAVSGEAPSRSTLMSVLYDPLSMPRMPLTPQHYAYVKIAEGCNRSCAFCAIPTFRGKQRSRSVASVVAEVNQLAARGVKEVNLIAQDTPSYGRDLDEKSDLATLLRTLLSESEIPWIRLFYLYPQGVSDEVIQLIADERRIVSYLDVPFQHFSERVLRRMKRPWSAANIEGLIRRFREAIPDATLRTTVLLGFPGENDDDFAAVLEAVERYRFDRLGVFTYSDEENTSAFQLQPQVDERTMLARKDRLMQLQQRISLEHNRNLIGRTIRDLVDGASA
ncbi:MAG: 30S ribosomal protein S12 methylthiotransferase RimO, partial [Myxococcales bacterium]|nr:30S ribosomal protein S12 methylthiotransferase RimO [Myxococcales bacterium]